MLQFSVAGSIRALTTLSRLRLTVAAFSGRGAGMSENGLSPHHKQQDL